MYKNRAYREVNTRCRTNSKQLDRGLQSWIVLVAVLVVAAAFELGCRAGTYSGT